MWNASSPDPLIRFKSESKNQLLGGNLRSIESLRIKLFCDGADFDSIMALYADSRIKGFTTNPTLMRKAGVLDYEAFARKLLKAIPDRPVSFEVFADNSDAMEMQALAIANWGRNVNVKIPVTNQEGEFMEQLIARLSRSGVSLNVTAILTLDQVERVAQALHPSAPAIVSVFAGRIADTGIDPVPVMKQARKILRSHPFAELLWASPRELLKCFSGRRSRLRHHHRASRYTPEAEPRGQGFGCILSGNSEHVSQGCARLRLPD